MFKKKLIDKTTKMIDKPNNSPGYEQRAKSLRKVSWLVLIGSLVLLLCIVIIKSYSNCLPNWLSIVIDFLIAILASVIAGAIVTIIFDIPALVGSFKDLVINSLTENRYLDGLKLPQLRSLKQDVIKFIHKENNLPQSLLQLETELSDTIDKPYYSYFNENVTCYEKGLYDDMAKLLASFNAFKCKHQDPTKSNGTNTFQGIKPNLANTPASANQPDEKYVLKDIDNEFEIINPGKDECTVDIGIRKSLELPPNRSISDMFCLQEFSVIIDGGDRIDINIAVETFSRQSVSRSSSETMTYNSTLGLIVPGLLDELTSSNIEHYKRDKNTEIECKVKEHDSPSLLKVKFKDRVRVKLKYFLMVSANDSHYTRRMRYAAQAFLFQYECKDNVQIHGQVLGTLLKQNKISILQNDSSKNRITIQCRDWLLPGNGIFVVLDDK